MPDTLPNKAAFKWPGVSRRASSLDAPSWWVVLELGMLVPCDSRSILLR